MKKNWAAILACLVFLLVWEFYVIKPYEAKNRKSAPPASTSTQTTSHPEALRQTPSAPSANNPQTIVNVLTAAEQQQAVSVRVGESRTVKVFPDLSVGSAVFNDYYVRGSANKSPVVLLPEGLHWTSTSADVQACLNGLKQGALNASSLAREYKTSAGSCSIRVTPDGGKAGLIRYDVTLVGFAGSHGLLEFRGADVMGNGGRADDHNYLGARIDGSRQWTKGKSLLEASRKEGMVDWLAWGDKYFVTTLLPFGSFNPNVVYGPVSQEKDSKVSFGFQYPLVSKSDAPSTYSLGVYLGPRDSEQLRAIDPRLSDAVDLGMFGAIARTLIWALKQLNRLFNNFGLSIIALTVLVRAAFWPLNRKVFVSGLKMKALQPQIERIRAKYGSDRTKMEQMNRELLGLYKTNKVNPAGSCLPMLLQLPIFIGLYAALNHSLDLYQAPFFGWIHDLSWKDPFYVFPALWTISLLAYMKLNPQGMQTQPGQPDMKWIMVGMNVFFGYLSKDWPAGLTLYLFVSNLVGIIQQVMLRRDPKLQPIQEGA